MKIEIRNDMVKNLFYDKKNRCYYKENKHNTQKEDTEHMHIVYSVILNGDMKSHKNEKK